MYILPWRAIRKPNAKFQNDITILKNQYGSPNKTPPDENFTNLRKYSSFRTHLLPLHQISAFYDNFEILVHNTHPPRWHLRVNQGTAFAHLRTRFLTLSNMHLVKISSQSANSFQSYRKTDGRTDGRTDMTITEALVRAKNKCRRHELWRICLGTTNVYVTN